MQGKSSLRHVATLHSQMVLLMDYRVADTGEGTEQHQQYHEGYLYIIDLSFNVADLVMDFTTLKIQYP